MISVARATFQATKFTDLVDILIIGVLIYMVLVWLKKARARLMLIGMGTIGLVYLLARYLGLYLTTMALQAFFAVALVMILIVFQDDLRHFFERIAVIGLTRRRRAGTPYDRTIDILLSALDNLARKKIGALIVIKGRDPLDRHLEAGIDLDGLLSHPVLESLFDPHVPTHDGAVIVEGDRIVRLGCHLPLSINVAEIGRFGTRHAAALGITEHTDALALVVSEEHGTVSVAEDGRMRHQKDMSHVRSALCGFYRQRFPERRGMGVTHALLRNVPEKIIAALLAVAIWATFGMRTEIIRRDIVMPVEYRNLASDRVIKDSKIKEVTVTVSGTEQAFGLLKDVKATFSLDLSNIGDGENRLVLTKEQVRNISGVTIAAIHPEEITLSSYRLIPLDIPLELRTWNRAPAGVTIRDIRVEPKTVSALFPSTLPKDKATISIDPVDLAAVTASVTLTPRVTVAPDVRFPGDKVPEIRIVIDVEKPPAPPSEAGQAAGETERGADAETTR